MLQIELIYLFRIKRVSCVISKNLRQITELTLMTYSIVRWVCYVAWRHGIFVRTWRARNGRRGKRSKKTVICVMIQYSLVRGIVLVAEKIVRLVMCCGGSLLLFGNEKISLELLLLSKVCNIGIRRDWVGCHCVLILRPIIHSPSFRRWNVIDIIWSIDRGRRIEKQRGCGSWTDIVVYWIIWVSVWTKGGRIRGSNNVVCLHSIINPKTCILQGATAIVYIPWL